MKYPQCFGLLALWLLACGAAQALPPLVISDQNASLTYITDEPGFNLVQPDGSPQPNNPVSLPRKVEWRVDGRRILVYPSGPSTFLDIAHLHTDAHVDAHQMHAQGPIIGYGTGAVTGNVLGGVVYTVHGGAAGSGRSRISEKVDIHNKTSGDVQLSLAGFGFKPTQASLEVPDLSGLNLTGSTIVFFQGNAQTNTFTEPPQFAPVTILPAVTFSGFNPLFNQTITLPAGARMTMVTELKVEPAPLLIVVWVLLALLVATALGLWAGARRRN